MKKIGLLLAQLLMKLERPINEVDNPFEWLSKYSPDKGKSCITHNTLQSVNSYDIQVIIPVYKTEQTLRQAIDSVLSQTGDLKIWITIVNDGSPDNSDAILKEYENIPNIEVITQENKGFSGARNTALKNIRAQYITFLDSDDWLPQNALKVLFDTAQNHDKDIVQGSFIRINNEGVEIKRDILPNKLEHGQLRGFPWGKLFKSELFKDIQFPENYWFEDTLMSIIIFPQVDNSKKASISTPTYCYRINPKGISQTAPKNKKILDTLYVTRGLYKDRLELGIPFLDYNTAILQACVNLIRIASHKNIEVTKIALTATELLLDQYFSQTTSNNREAAIFRKSLKSAKFNSTLFIASVLL
ncbi:MAG: glycosyltransferase [Muribaculaceae bacterium]|nr:glycosyltransferase [Muribaculaceae bacterium]